MALTSLDKIGICNAALMRIGVKRKIQSITESTAEAEACDQFYDHSLQEILEEAGWRFARKRLALSLVADESTDEWDYAYTYPSDCMLPLWIEDGILVHRLVPVWWDDYRIPVFSTDKRISFVIELASGAKVIRTNQPDATLVYTSEVEDVALMPAKFRDYLAWRLAANIALPLTADRDMVLYAQGKADEAKAEALKHDFDKSVEPPPPDSEFVRARY